MPEGPEAPQDLEVKKIPDTVEDNDPSEKQRDIIAFLGGDSTSLFKDAEDTERRESSLMSAMAETAEDYPDLEPVDICKMIYPGQLEQLFAMPSKDFWDSFDELIKTTPQTLIKFKILKDAKDMESKFDCNRIPDNFFDEYFTNELFEARPVTVATYVNKWKEEHFAPQLCLNIISNRELLAMIPRNFLASIRGEVYAEEIYSIDATDDPRFYLKWYSFYGKESYANRVLKIAIDSTLVSNEFSDIANLVEYYHLFCHMDKAYVDKIMKTIRSRMNSFGGEMERVLGNRIAEAKIFAAYLDQSDIKGRVQYLESEVMKINPNFKSELRAFNEENGVSMKLMGAKKRPPLQYVFVNTWANPEDSSKVPLRFQIDAKGIKDDFKRTLSYFLEFEREENEEQIDIWKKRQFDYDIPKDGKASFMIATVPDDLVGIETDGLEMSKIFRERYGAEWSSVLMQHEAEWEKIKPRDEEVPGNIEPTKENILSEFENGLRGAIDSGYEKFVFYYLMHGLDDGTIGGTDGLFNARDFVDVLIKEHNGEPIISQIEVDILAESCFSGSQLQIIVEELQKTKVPVKGIHISTAASHKKVAEGGLDPTNASLIASNALDDRSGAMAYYISYYFEMIDYLKGQGQDIKPPLDTMGHAIAFADRMAKEDSHTNQDLQSYYYSTMDENMTDPEEVRGKKEDGKENPPATTSSPSSIGSDENTNKSPMEDEESEPAPSGYYISRNEGEKPDVFA